MKCFFRYFACFKSRRSNPVRTLFLSLGLLLATSISSQGQTDHPRIWVTPADRADILEKIENHAYASDLFGQLKERADDAVARHQADRDSFLKALPLDWSAGTGTHPVFRRISTSDQTDRYIIMPYLQDAIDCGVVYYLTGDEAYAQCAADIMGVFISGLAQMEPGNNGGLLYPDGSSDHLLEARIVGAQIPVACDFIMPFVRGGGKVYDVATGSERAFPVEEAQDVFKKYITMAIEVGHSGTNWSVLESPSLLCNILALENEAEVQAYLPYYLTKQSPRQDPLSTVAQSYPNRGDVWPESIHYSSAVASFSIYLMTILDRLYPSLDLAQTYPNILEAPSKDYLLQYPNGKFISYGDTTRRYHIEYTTFENAYLLAKTAGMDRYTQMYGSLLKTALNGAYDRSSLPERSFAATVYKSPLKLLWSVPELEGEEKDYERPRTVELPFAGIYIQRNTSATNPVKNGLMAFVGGGHYVHGHASGMNIELYAEGHVLGADAGKGTYRTDIHENYYRIFAAHNTVVSNGASASSGGWVNLGMEQLELMHMEPMPEAEAVSPNHSFSTTRFHDIHNLVAPAMQERTLAVIRTSPATGYYVDVYRARSDTPDQFHDYLYHNIGEKLTFTGKPEGFCLSPDPDRFQASADLPWKQNSQFRHPGWHFFKDVETSSSTDAAVTARFEASELESDTIFMDVYMNKGSERTYTRAMAPPTVSSLEYEDKPTPTLVVRQKGEAWTNPFAFVYSASSKQDSMKARDGVQSVKSLSEDGKFKGLIVESRVNGKVIRNYILVLENSDKVYRSVDPEISFTGHFGVITVDENGQLISLYLGDGESLQYKGTGIKADEESGAAFARF